METPTKKGPKHAPGIVVRDGGSLLVTISEQGRVVKFTPVNSSMQQALDLVAEKKPIPVPSTEVFIQVFAQEKKDKKKVPTVETSEEENEAPRQSTIDSR